MPSLYPGRPTQLFSKQPGNSKTLGSMWFSKRAG